MAPSLNWETLVTVFGGSGFLGRHVVRALVKRNFRIRVAVRRPDLAGHLQPLGEVGQIYAVQANVRFRDSVMAAVRDSAVVVNLVGLRVERWRQRFHAVHVLGAEAIAMAATAAGAELVHVSALGADESARSAFARTKALGEKAVSAAAPGAMIFRPAVMFGPHDHFLNKFAAMARLSPVLPLIAGGRTRLQPVFAGDVAEAIARVASGEAAPGTAYELGGPEIFSLRELIEVVLAIVGRRRLLVPAPLALARLGGAALRFLPQPWLAPDPVELSRPANVVSPQAIEQGRTFASLGVAELHSIPVIAPIYLRRYRKAGQFSLPHPRLV